MSAFLTPVVALLGIYIAYRQWLTAQEKLRHDLFDRRLEIYDAARCFVDYILQIHDVVESRKSDHLLRYQCEFISGVREAKWLLNKDISVYFEKELLNKSGKLRDLLVKLERADYPENGFNDILEERDKIIDWFNNQYDLLDNKFSSFLKLDNKLRFTFYFNAQLFAILFTAMCFIILA